MHLELRMADEGVFFAPTANKARKSTGLRSMRLLLARLSVVSVLLGSDLPARSQVDVSNDLSRQSCTMTWSACSDLRLFKESRGRCQSSRTAKSPRSASPKTALPEGPSKQAKGESRPKHRRVPSAALSRPVLTEHDPVEQLIDLLHVRQSR